MKRAKIGWNFPPTNGGREDGFNDAGIATFVGRPLQSLAREIIQNSLDARQDQDIPVHIDFEIIDLTESVDFGRDELQLALESCLQASNLDGKAIRTLCVVASLQMERTFRCHVTRPHPKHPLCLYPASSPARANVHRAGQ